MPESHRPKRYGPSFPIIDPNPRIGDLIVYHKVLLMLCRRCSRTAEMSPALLEIKSRSYDTRVSQIVRRARCVACGSRSITGTVKDPAPSGKP
jgi:hypothetical protein